MTTTKLPKVIVIGYGNPGRLDDGLGPAFAAAIENMNLPNVTTDADYQLTIEDAATIAQYDIVLFVDAAVSGPEPFSCSILKPEPATSFTSHSVAPGQVLYLAQTLFSANIKTYLMGIRGYAFNEFEEKLSDKAIGNLEKAIRFFRELSDQDWSFETINSENTCCPVNG